MARPPTTAWILIGFIGVIVFIISLYVFAVQILLPMIIGIILVSIVGVVIWWLTRNVRETDEAIAARNYARNWWFDVHKQNLSDEFEASERMECPYTKNDWRAFVFRRHGDRSGKTCGMIVRKSGFGWQMDYENEYEPGTKPIKDLVDTIKNWILINKPVISRKEAQQIYNIGVSKKELEEEEGKS